MPRTCPRWRKAAPRDPALCPAAPGPDRCCRPSTPGSPTSPARTASDQASAAGLSRSKRRPVGCCADGGRRSCDSMVRMRERRGCQPHRVRVCHQSGWFGQTGTDGLRTAVLRRLHDRCGGVSRAAPRVACAREHPPRHAAVWAEAGEVGVEAAGVALPRGERGEPEPGEQGDGCETSAAVEGPEASSTSGCGACAGGPAPIHGCIRFVCRAGVMG